MHVTMEVVVHIIMEVAMERSVEGIMVPISPVE